MENGRPMTPLNYGLHFWIMTGIFYSWDSSIFQYQIMRKYRVGLGLVYKMFVNKHICETLLLPQKTNSSRNAGFFGKLNKVIFPLQPKTQLFGDLPHEQVPCSRMKSVGVRLLSLMLMQTWVCSSGRNAHIRSSTLQEETQKCAFATEILLLYIHFDHV